MRSKAIEMLGGRRLDQVSSRGIRAIATELHIVDHKTDTIEHLKVAIRTALGVEAEGKPE